VFGFVVRRPFLVAWLRDTMTFAFKPDRDFFIRAMGMTPQCCIFYD
jgi:hypothetical protein